jgi:hypothetical protein
MYPTSSVVATITTDRIRQAEIARAGRSDKIDSAEPRRIRRLRGFAARIAAPGLR